MKNENKSKIPLIIIIVSICITGTMGIYMGALLLDSQADRAKCSADFEKITNITGMAYANDDFRTLNLGQGIKCTVFWMDRYCLTETDFIAGTLTWAQVNSSRYC
jgi:flagellar basal body-associated protein FliL